MANDLSGTAVMNLITLGIKEVVFCFFRVGYNSDIANPVSVNSQRLEGK